MDIIFSCKEKFGREVYLTKERWKHICREHVDMSNELEIQETLMKPLFIKTDIEDEKVNYYYTYRKDSKKYLMVAVKYLNGNGFVITCFHTRKIRP